MVPLKLAAVFSTFTFVEGKPRSIKIILNNIKMEELNLTLARLID